MDALSCVDSPPVDVVLPTPHAHVAAVCGQLVDCEEGGEVASSPSELSETVVHLERLLRLFGRVWANEDALY